MPGSGGLLKEGDALRGLDGIDFLDEFVFLYFLNELEQFVSGDVEVTDPGVKTVVIHEVVDVFQHVSTLRLGSKYLIQKFVYPIGNQYVPLG